MLTNTYKPHLSGVARSIETYRDRLLKHGHRVVVIAPEYPGATQEPFVFRIPSYTNNSGYSIPLLTGLIKNTLNCCIGLFKPDIVHSHHPFLLGDAAIEIGKSWNAPVVFTYHTVYEEQFHHSGLPEDFKDAGQVAVISKCLSYCNKVDHIIAPSNGIKSMLRARGVMRGISVIPTGIDDLVFNGANRESTRNRLGVLKTDYVLGHVGRLTKEKNLFFLFNAIRHYLLSHKDARFILVGGQSPDIEELLSLFRDLRGVQFIYVGVKRDNELADIYSAMDCFLFASKTETQGMVLAEAILCGVPVVAIRANGVNDIVKNCLNGVFAEENARSFSHAIDSCKMLDRRKIANSAFSFTIEFCLYKLLNIYKKLSYNRKVASIVATIHKRKSVS